MSDAPEYFKRAESWATDSQERAARSRRIAWTVAGTAVAVALFEAVALAMLTPLKTVQPITLLVDRQTGYVQALDPMRPQRISADEALTEAQLAQYVTAREGFDRATVSVDYRRVALWSTGRARSTYLAAMPATSPTSPFQRYPRGSLVTIRVKSVSRLDRGVALVRFDSQRQDQDGSIDVPQYWISVIRFRYTDAPMRMEDRLVNPLGFQVTGYRRDAEAPPPPSTEQATVNDAYVARSQQPARTNNPFGASASPRAIGEPQALYPLPIAPANTTGSRPMDPGRPISQSRPQPGRSIRSRLDPQARQILRRELPSGSPLSSGSASQTSPTPMANQ